MFLLYLLYTKRIVFDSLFVKYIEILCEIFLDFLCYSECLEVFPSEGNVSLLDLVIFFGGGASLGELFYLIILPKYLLLMSLPILCFHLLLHDNHVRDNSNHLVQLH